MAKLQPFHGCDASSILARPIYDFVAKLVKASDCNSEGVSSTLTEIFSCGKPDAKTHFWMYTKLRCVSSILTTALSNYP